MELLSNDPGLTRTLAIALVDVVMETDHAGLDFSLKAFVSQDFGYGNELHLGYDFFGERYIGGGDLAEKSTYDALIGDLMKQAAEDLEKSLASNKGIAVEVPSSDRSDRSDSNLDDGGRLRYAHK